MKNINKITQAILQVEHKQTGLVDDFLRFFGAAAEDVRDDIKDQLRPRIQDSQQKLEQLTQDMIAIAKVLHEAGIFAESVEKKAGALVGHGKEAAEIGPEIIDQLNDIATLTRNLPFLLEQDIELSAQALKALIAGQDSRQAAVASLTDEEFTELQKTINRDSQRRARI